MAEPTRRDAQSIDDLTADVPGNPDAVGESSSADDGSSAEEVHHTRIGEYTIKRVIASGGMGTVYLAQQERPRRPVALKVMKQGLASRSMLRRFEFESQVLGRLRHPNIAQVYGAGTHDDGAGGTPYFAMEYVPNARTLTEYAIVHELRTRERLGLFAKVCDAVHHGHQKGIIHRDLKPSNILVDSGGEPKIIDFGVARATDADMAVTTLQTDVGQLIGTLQYMSPEQCDADPHDLDVRSDVYSLGVVLYELLCERPPYELQRAAIHEVTRRIREQPPTRLSTVDGSLGGDVETIVHKALEKDRSRRYQSAASLADDIRRYLRSEPIEARPPSAMYQLAKFAARNRLAVSAVAVIALSLVAGVVTTSIMYLRSEHQRGRAEQAQRDAERARDDLSVVASFQSEMIESIDAEAMGLGLLGALRQQARTNLMLAETPPEEVEQFMSQMSVSMAAVNPTDFARTVIQQHMLEPAAIALDRDYSDRPVIEASIRATIGQAYFSLGRPDAAEAHARRALELFETHVGPDDPRSYGAANDLALVLTSLARYDEAGAVIERSLARQRDAVGDDHAITLSTKSNLAILRRVQGRIDEAEQLYTEVLETRTRLFGRDHPQTVTAMNNLAVLYEGLSRTEEAAELFTEALAIYEAIAAPRDPNVLTTMTNLGLAMQGLGRYSQAEQLFLRALSAQRSLLGSQHSNTLSTINNLGALYVDQGRYEDAEPLLRESYETTLQLLGDRHPDTLLALGNLAATYNSMNEVDRAEPLLVEIVDAQSELLGRETRETLSSMNNLAFAYDVQGKAARAEALYREVLDTQLRVFGEDDPDTMLSMYNLGRMYEDLERYEESESLVGRATALARSHLPHDHPMTAIFGSGHASCLIKLARYEAAEEALDMAYPALVATFGEDGERTQHAVERYIALYEGWNRPEQAARWKEKLIVRASD